VIRTISSEWIKLRTVLSHKVLVVIAVVFPVVVGLLVASFGDMEGGPSSSAEMAEFVTGMMVVSTMLLGVVAVIGLTSEFTHNTLRPTYAASPKRARVLAAKVLVSTAVTAVIAILVALSCWFVTATIFNSRGGDVSITGDRVAAMLSSAVVLAVVVTWFGFGLGLIIRNSPATVSILLLWPLLIETLLIVVINLIGWDSLDQYMPYQGAIIAGGVSPDDSSLGRPGAHLYFAAIALALIAIGVMLDEHRDA
jgi:ABC-2 type transport system permease protein